MLKLICLFFFLVVTPITTVKVVSMKKKLFTRDSSEPNGIIQDEIGDQFLDEDLAKYLENNDNSEDEDDDDENDSDFLKENSEEPDHEDDNDDPLLLDSFNHNDGEDFDDFTKEK